MTGPPAGSDSTASPTSAAAEYRAFGAPQRVTIRGYDGDAMEPFITKDGRYLLFNNRNDPRTNTNLHFAARVDDLTFQYRGEIGGVNTPVLEGVPSLEELVAREIEGLIFSYELFDALPVHRLVERPSGGLGELWVGLREDGAFCWQEGELSRPEFEELLRRYEEP